MLEVVAALVREGDRFLICRRPMHKARGGQWEFAGGKVEAGETHAQAIAREIREELDLILDVSGPVCDVAYAYPDLTVHLTLMEAKVVSGELRRLEHTETAWITINEAHKYDFCPADRLLLRQLFKRAWLHEQDIAHIHGWDFSYLDGRYTEEDALPWDYRSEIEKHLQPEHKLLDIDTGGGEFLLSLNHPFENTAATENYPPNVELCKSKLLPLGIDFRPADGAGRLPYADASFDVVINRHGDFNPAEIHRVLRPGGLFITQQVGAENDRELVDLLLPGTPMPFPDQYLHIAEEQFRRAGFAILDAQEAFNPIRFFDVGALVWFARIIQWEFPGFSVEENLDKLFEAQRMLEEQGYIEAKTHRFLLLAQKQ